MKMPGFTAQSSLYRTRAHYRSTMALVYDAGPGRSVVAALNFEDRGRCARCETKCAESYTECIGVAAAVWTVGLAGCAFAGPFFALCATPVTVAYALAGGACIAKLVGCEVVCNAPGGSSCCPVFCELGHCCSRGETCYSGGCCPGDRAVCGNNCCSPGEKCCGDSCCPAGFYCLDGNFCSEFPSSIPFGNPPPPPLPFNNCISGGAPCGPECCPPGLECCYYSAQFGAVCKTSCLH